MDERLMVSTDMRVHLSIMHDRGRFRIDASSKVG